jgi:5-oxoprolinase (ATP-hydrolysing) subunit C
MQIDVLAGGPLLTVQDLGRSGARRYGVPPGGAMDAFAAAAANRLVGNPPAAPLLEITAGAARLQFSHAGSIAVCGGDLQPLLDGRPAANWLSLSVRAGSLLEFRSRRPGSARAYLAVAGRLQVERAVGGCGTDLAGGFGGFAGRALRAGDQLTVQDARRPPALNFWPATHRPAYRPHPQIRLMRGPHADLIGAAAWQALLAADWQISTLSSRQGFRCDGPALPLPSLSISSLGVVPGALQLPPDGRPIVLMADAQTTGGYPLIAVAYSADLPLIAQLLPGDRLTFVAGDHTDAQAALHEQAAWLAAGPRIDEGLLLADSAGALP